MPSRIDDGLAAAGFAQPFMIQTAAIPVAMDGRDVCGRARTGSGKTLAFGVPMLARIQDEAPPSRPLGLVLVPTRELAVQVAEVLDPVARHAGQRIIAVYGGASRQDQVDALREGVEIVVATPLRLIDLLKSDEVSLADVDVVVLDEADRMADDGFTPQVEWILRHCTGSHPDDAVLGDARRRRRRTSSATTSRIRSRSPSTRPRTPSARCTTSSSPSTTWTRRGSWRRSARASPGWPCSARRSGCATRSPPPSTELGVDAQAIHGDLPQIARERALRRFAEGKLAVLVATDVAARGLDIDDIGAVIHYDPPKDAKDYLHRSGRTARAGRDGWAITFVEYNQHTQMRILQRTLRLPLAPPIEVFSNDERLRDLAAFERDLVE